MHSAGKVWLLLCFQMALTIPNLLTVSYLVVESIRHDSTSCKYFHEHVNDRRRDPFTEVETAEITYSFARVVSPCVSF